MKILVIFGAPDQEATTARKILADLGIATATATLDGEPVHAGNAYKASAFQVDPGVNISGTTSVALFECGEGAAIQNTIIARFDHHNPGDPGYGRPAEQSVEASSLGQLAEYFGVELDEMQRAIAAADHNLAAAYSGQVPGIDPDLVKLLRATELASRAKLSDESALAAFEDTVAAIQSAPRVYNGQVADLRGKTPSVISTFLSDAAAYAGTPTIGHGDTRSPEKLNLAAATAEQVTAFLGAWGNELGLVPGKSDPTTNPNGRYGVPARGFAGGVVLAEG
jgi:hypothetical protein